MSAQALLSSRTLRALFSALFWVIVSASVDAERLPWTTYTDAQGLPATEVNTAIEDRQGFLWLGTDRGIARFDGVTFRHFGKEHGLTRTNVTSLAFTHDGTLWVGSWGGVFQFNADDRGSFVEVPVESRRPLERTHLFTGPDGALWCVADFLYRLEPGSSPRFRRATIKKIDSLEWVTAFLADRSGNLWIAFTDVYRVDPSGHVVRVAAEGALPGEMNSIVEDSRGRVWIGASNGLWTADPRGPGSSEFVLRRRFSVPNQVGRTSLVPREGGGVWAGLGRALLEFDGEGKLAKRITSDEGLLATQSGPLLIDHAGDLWVSGASGGIQRLAAEGFSSFGSSEGLEAPLVRAIWQRRSGELIVAGGPDRLQRYDGKRFIATRPAFPAAIRPGWGWFQVDMEDRAGRWWFPTSGALVQFPPVKRVEDLAHTRASAVYRQSGCFQGRDVFRVYEDSRGDIWIGTISRNLETVYRWSRSTRTFECFSSAAIVGVMVAPTAFLDDGAGSMWVGFYDGQIGQYRNGVWKCLIDCAGTNGNVNAMFLDSHGRLWIATLRQGVLRLDHPTTNERVSMHFTTENGLASDRAFAVTEDRYGRIYIGTDRGIDVFEDGGTRIRHFGTADGLPQSFVGSAYTDTEGRLWFGTLNGVARFTPPAKFRDTPPIRLLVDAIRISGIPRPLSSSGHMRITDLLLRPNERDVVIDFVGLPGKLAPALKFQYRIGSNAPWSAASATRSVALAGLAPGNYTVEIRALGADDRPSPQTAVVSFEVLAPLYVRGWFMAVVAISIVALGVLAYRARVRHLLALERQRTRIAMDLHDEMGSRLGSIGLLADLARQDSMQLARRDNLLEQVAQTAADVGSSLTDIVWSLRPGETSLESLGRHLADHGRRLFPGDHPALDVRFPSTLPHVEMSLAARRNVFLIGVEALHNAARHSRAQHVVLDLQRRSRGWQLTVRDDGTGVDRKEADRSHRGFGFESMQQRAAEIGASLDVETRAGTGTTVTLVFDPLAEDRRLIPHTNIRETWRRIRGMSLRQ